jgi:nicotinamidase/pyrazinamidase
MLVSPSHLQAVKFCARKKNKNLAAGRFGVPEGELIVPTVVRLIDAAVRVGAKVVATRDYHPHDHSSFLPCGGL